MRKLGIVTLCLLAIYGLARAADVENPFRPPATTCTNQFVRSLAVLTGVGTCATVNFASDGTGIVPAANGGAGTVNGALAGNGSGAVSQAACANLSNAAASCATDATNAANITSGTLPAARLPSGALTNSLGGNVALNSTGTYFDGPSVAQGTTGTWFASGSVALTDSGVAAGFACKLWDGTTVISSGFTNIPGIGGASQLALSGFIASPAANIKISCKDPSGTTGSILFNASGNSKDSTIVAYRIN